MVLPVLRTLFPFPPLHVRPVGHWPVGVWSVCGQAVGSLAVWSVPGGASRRMVGLFAVGPVIRLQAPAQSFWWVVVPVVRLCVARERSGCCSSVVGGWLCGSRPAFGVLVDWPATSQLVVTDAAASAGPGCGGGFSVARSCPCR